MCTYEKSDCTNQQLGMTVNSEVEENYSKRLQLFNLLADKAVGYKSRIPEVEVTDKNELCAFTTVKYCFVKKIHSRTELLRKSNIKNENNESVFSVLMFYDGNIAPLTSSGDASGSKGKTCSQESEQEDKICGEYAVLPLSRCPSVKKAAFECISKELNTSDFENINCAELKSSLAAPLIIFLSGASGSGKSTLAALLAFYFSIKTIVSTDHIRSCLRLFFTKEELPFLFVSTYETGQLLQQKKNCSTSKCILEDEYIEMINNVCAENKDKEYSTAPLCILTSSSTSPSFSGSLENFSPNSYCSCVDGFLKQSSLLSNVICDVVSEFVKKKESVIVEGVHLTIPLVKHLKSLYPTNCIGFIVYLKSSKIHLERLNNRKQEEKYLKHIKSIRCIQRYFCEEAAMTNSEIISIENFKVSEAACRVVDNVENFLRRMQDKKEI